MMDQTQTCTCSLLYDWQLTAEEGGWMLIHKDMYIFRLKQDVVDYL